MLWRFGIGQDINEDKYHESEFRYSYDNRRTWEMECSPKTLVPLEHSLLKLKIELLALGFLKLLTVVARTCLAIQIAKALDR